MLTREQELQVEQILEKTGNVEGLEYIQRLKDELRSKVDYIHEQDEIINDYKHRVKVAEQALLNLAYKIVIYIGTHTSDFSSIAVGNAKNYIELEIAAENIKNVELKQAKKELVEGGKDG